MNYYIVIDENREKKKKKKNLLLSNIIEIQQNSNVVPCVLDYLRMWFEESNPILVALLERNLPEEDAAFKTRSLSQTNL